MADFSLAPPKKQGMEIFNLDPPGKTYTEDYSKIKAERFSKTIQSNPPVDTVQKDVQSGQQERWKQILQQQEQLQMSQLRSDILTEITSGEGAVNDPNVIQAVLSLSDDDLVSPDLDNILESTYSRMFAKDTSAAPDASLFMEAEEENPRQTSIDLNQAMIPMAERVMIAQDKLAELDKQREDASWLSVGADFAKSFIPGYDWWKTRNVVEGAKTSSLLQGNNLMEQVAYLHSLPPA